MDSEWTQRIERQMHTLDTRTAVEQVHRAAVERRLSVIEDTLKWLVRLVIGALITAAIAYVIKFGVLPVDRPITKASCAATCAHVAGHAPLA